jgi:uncharacterized protein (TIGR03067 family)
MKPLMLTLAVLALTFGAQDPKQELDQLQGTWKAVALQEGGKEVKGEAAEHFRLIVQGDKFTLKSRVADEYQQTRYTGRLDPGKEPKAIDLTDSTFEVKESVLQGIYELKGEVLRLRLAKPGQKRPPGFAGPSEPGWVFVVLQRDKP